MKLEIQALRDIGALRSEDAKKPPSFYCTFDEELSSCGEIQSDTECMV